MAKYIGIPCTNYNGEKVISILRDVGINVGRYKGRIGDAGGYYILDTISKEITDCQTLGEYSHFREREASCVNADMRIFKLDLDSIKTVIQRSKAQSIIPFLLDAAAGESSGGFTWSETSEGHEYWRKLILDPEESETIIKSDKNEDRLQKKTVNLTRGERDTGRTVCYRQSKITVAVGHLSNQEISC